MIGRVISRPKRPHRLLAYLFGPGRNNEHVNPHLVAAWAGHPAHLEPPGEGTEGRQTYRLAQILEMPAALARGKVPDKLVWHCVVSAADGDPDLGDGAWQVIIAETMHRAGLSEHGEEDKGVRWVAVHHGGNHVHVVATLARMDGRPVRLHGDWYRVQEAMAWAEREYGLTPVARGGPRGTAERRPTRAEAEKAGREHKKAGRPGRPVPARSSCAAWSRRPPRPPGPRTSSSPGSRPAVSLPGSGTAPPGPVRSPGTPSACAPTPPGPGAARSGSAGASWPRTSPCPGSAPAGQAARPGPDRCTRTGPPGTGPGQTARTA